MPYSATWTNGHPRVQPGVHGIRLCDVQELAAAINRRRRLTFQNDDDFSSRICQLADVRQSLLAGGGPLPFTDFRTNITSSILSPPVGVLPGMPPSPTSMHWLWPHADANEDKVIVNAAPASGQVNLFQGMGGPSNWTDPLLSAGMNVRAVHMNELRGAVECLTRGRWKLPVYLAGGLFSLLPDSSWFGGAVANNGSAELRTVGFSLPRTGNEPQGLTAVNVRPSSRIEIIADLNCQVQIFRCKRAVDFYSDLPTWKQYAPAANLSWSQSGGTGGDDASEIGTLAMQEGQWSSLSGELVTQAMQSMIDGQPPNLLVRRSDIGGETVSLEMLLVIEFDLASPPN